MPMTTAIKPAQPLTDTARYHLADVIVNMAIQRLNANPTLETLAAAVDEVLGDAGSSSPAWLVRP